MYHILVFVLFSVLTGQSIGLQIQLISASSTSTKSCLQIDGLYVEEGEALICKSCRLYDYQLWEINSLEESIENGTYLIPIQQPDPLYPKVLTEDENPQYASRKIIVRTINQTPGQLWHFNKTSSEGVYKIVSNSSGMCLNNGGTRVNVEACSATAKTQEWKVVEMSDDIKYNDVRGQEKFKVVLQNRRENYCLDHFGFVHHERCDLRGSQIWEIGNWDYMRNGTIIEIGSAGYFLTEDGDFVNIEEGFNEDKNQTWIFQRVSSLDESYYFIKSKNSERSLLSDIDALGIYMGECSVSSIVPHWKISQVV